MKNRREQRSSTRIKVTSPCHYVELSSLVEYSPLRIGGSDRGWWEIVLNDLTHGGEKLSFVGMAPREGRRAARVFGRSYVATCFERADRTDTIVVSTLEPLEAAPPKGARTYDAAFRLLVRGRATLGATGRDAASLDRLVGLFEIDAPRPTTPATLTGESELRPRAHLEPNPASETPENLTGERETSLFAAHPEPPHVASETANAVFEKPNGDSVDPPYAHDQLRTDELPPEDSEAQSDESAQSADVLENGHVSGHGADSRRGGKAALAADWDAASTASDRASHRRPDCELWALRTRGVDTRTLDAVVARVASAASVVARLTASRAEIERGVDLLDAASSMQVAVADLIRELPGRDDLAGMPAAYNLAESAHRLFGSDAPRVLEAAHDEATLHDIIDTWSQRNVLQALPGWFWSDEGQLSLVQDDWLGRLTSQPNRVRARWAIDDLGLASLDDATLTSLSSMPRPESGLEETTLIRRVDLQRALSELDADLSGWVAEAPPSEVEARRKHAFRLHLLRQQLSEDARVAATSELLQAPSAELPWLFDELERVLSVVDAKATGLGSQTPWPVLKLLFNPMPANAARADDGPRAPMRIRHDYVSAGTLNARRRAALHFVGTGQSLGHVDVPLVISTSGTARPHESLHLSLRFDLDETSAFRRAIPQQWSKVSPAEVSIGSGDWAPSGSDEQVFAFTIRIPIRAPEQGHDTLRLKSIRAEDARTGRIIAQTEEHLTWETILGTPPAVSLDWSEGHEAEYVARHPVGPQRHLRDLKDRIREGNCFAVLARRRFGKSTLLKYLAAHADELEVDILEPISCTRYSEAEQLWRDVIAALYRQVAPEDALPAVDFTKGQHAPGPKAFDAPRRRARQAGKRAIVILLDEAQAMFGQGSAGQRLGIELAALWKDHLGSRTDTMVPVVFGLAGLPSLSSRRTGPDFWNIVFAPPSHQPLRADDLEKLVAGVTKGLSTTVTAREELARLSDNLHVLRTLIREATNEREHRAWVSRTDVLAAHRLVLERLRRGDDETIAQLTRDVFDASEGLAQFCPIDSYPVAVAVRDMLRVPSGREGDVVANVTARLNAWVSELVDQTQASLYTPGRVREHLNDLEERGILRGAGVELEDRIALDFTSEYLGAWLDGQIASGQFRTGEFRTALYRGGIPRLALPPDAQHVGSGGQADIYRFSRDGAELCMRVVRVQDDADGLREFHDTVDMLRALVRLKASGDNLRGTEFLSQILEVGVLGGSPLRAGQVYAWVDGEDLESRASSLPVTAVVRIGRELASALSVLHAHGMLHRDVRPANVVLATGTNRAVLIDFGFARLTSRALKTKLMGPAVAPEVAAGKGWSAAADIFSLSWTLKRLLLPSCIEAASSRPLLAILERCSGEGPATRPEAKNLAAELEALEDTLRVKAAASERIERLRGQVAADLKYPTFAGVFEKFSGAVAATSLGYHPDLITRCSQAADFLNQLLEAHCNASLGALPHGAAFLPLHQDPGRRYVKALRNCRAHGREFAYEGDRRLLAEFEKKRPDQKKDVVLQFANVLDRAANLRSARSMVSALMEG